MEAADVEKLWAMKEALEATCAKQEVEIKRLKSDLEYARKVSDELGENTTRLRAEARRWEETATTLARALGERPLGGEFHDSVVENERSIEIKCSYCAREPGQPCRRSLPNKRPHLERRLDALNQLESRK